MMLLCTHTKKILSLFSSQNNFAVWGRAPEMEADLKNMTDKDNGISAWECRQAQEKVRRSMVCCQEGEWSTWFIPLNLHSPKWWWAYCYCPTDTKKEGEGDFVTVKNAFLTLHTDFKCGLDIWLHHNLQKWEFREATDWLLPACKNNVEKLFYLLVSFCEKKVMLERKTIFNKKLKFYLLCCIPLTK